MKIVHEQPPSRKEMTLAEVVKDVPRGTVVQRTNGNVSDGKFYIRTDERRHPLCRLEDGLLVPGDWQDNEGPKYILVDTKLVVSK